MRPNASDPSLFIWLRQHAKPVIALLFIFGVAALFVGITWNTLHSPTSATETLTHPLNKETAVIHSEYHVTEEPQTAPNTTNAAAAQTDPVYTVAAVTSAPETAVSEDWWAAAQESIRQSEYQISPAAADGSRSSATYQAPNRAHNFRTHFSDQGIQLTPRTEAGYDWTWYLNLTAYGIESHLRPLAHGAPFVDGNQITYDYGPLQAWYINSDLGLEQGFTLTEPPQVPIHNQSDNASTVVVIRLTPKSNLSAEIDDTGSAVTFYTPGRRPQIQYDHLYAYDATNRQLPAEMRLTNCEDTTCTLDLVVDAAGATYPIIIDPLASSPDWQETGGQANADFGFSLDGTGDVNNDGYDDILIGAPQYDAGYTDEGAVFLYYGGAAISDTATIRLDGGQTDAQFGYAVAGAGDVDGDGYDDILIGAPYYTDVYTGEGRVSLYYGSSSGIVTSTVWTTTGDMSDANFGFSVAGAGDVNGDSFADFLVGAPTFANGNVNEGQVSLYYGSSSGVTASPWTIEGNSSNTKLGYALDSAGDVNNDGYDDILLGGPEYRNTELREGYAAVYLGSSSGISSTTPVWSYESNETSAFFGRTVAGVGDIDGNGYDDIAVAAHQHTGDLDFEGGVYLFSSSASGIALTPTWQIEGDVAYGKLGEKVAAAGDVNNDGYDDLLVSSIELGQVRVYYGSASGLGSIQDWYIQSNNSGDGLGSSVAAIGDANNDGYDDILIGLPQANGYGQAFGYYGSANGPSGLADWTAEGDQADAHLGLVVADAGDVNNDGYDDLMVSAPEFDDGGTNNGKLFVYYGNSSGINSDADWTAIGNAGNTSFGEAIGTAGDVNGDGYDEILVGAYRASNGQTREGQVTLYYGSASGVTTNTWTVEGNIDSIYFGNSVASAGDVNNDGFDDILIGALRYTDGQIREGRAYLYLGSSGPLSTTAVWTVEGGQQFAYLGDSVAGAGDVNNDGYDDVIIGAYGYDGSQNDAGQAMVYLGNSSGLAITPTWTATGNQLGEGLGHAVAAAGDVDGDGYDDLIVSAPTWDIGSQTDIGKVTLYLGNSSGVSSVPAITLTNGITGSQFGYAIDQVGDMDGDGYGDIIIGAPYLTNEESNEGRGEVYFGSSSGIVTPATWQVDGKQAGAQLGTSVSSAGDLNGDGYSDVVLGAPYYTAGETEEGTVFVFYGAVSGATPPTANFDASPQNGTSPLSVTFTNSSSNSASYSWQFGDGTTTTNVAPTHVYTAPGVYSVTLTATGPGGQDSLVRTNYITVSQPITFTLGWILDGNQASASYGFAARTAGDVNGDGHADVIISAPYQDGPGGIPSNGGQAWLYYGSATGLATLPPWTITGTQDTAWLGYGLSSAGDLNGDGYDDLVVGTRNYDTLTHTNAGRIDLFYGSANGVGQTPDTTLYGDMENAYYGHATAPAGDVNNDGYGDLLVGARGYSNGENGEGRVYLYYGGAAGLQTATPWHVESNYAGAWFGYAVDGAGDVNGDGYDDILIGALYDGDGTINGGKAYVYLGSSAGMTTTNHWEVASDQDGSQLGTGTSVAGVGDVNNDGYDDILVGAQNYSDPESEEGKVFLYAGSSSGLSQTPLWTADGGQASTKFGWAVGSLGDLNHDDHADFIVGGDEFDTVLLNNAGRANLYLGAAPTPAAIPYWTEIGGQVNGRFGHAVGTAGDIDGNGYNDLIISEQRYSNGEIQEGRVLIYYTTPITPIQPTAGFSYAPTTGSAPLTVYFTSTATYAATHNWDFGDGSSSSLPNPNHTYTQTGSFTVALTVSNSAGLDVLPQLITVTESVPPPVASFVAEPTEGTAPLTVTFTNQSIVSGVATYSWDFGDGATSNEENKVHVYTDVGAYTATLTVNTTSGVDVASQLIVVTGTTNVTADFTAEPLSGSAPLTVTFTNLSENGVSYLWEFGDGYTSVDETPTHVYISPGLFNVSLTAYGNVEQDSETKQSYIWILSTAIANDDFVRTEINTSISINVLENDVNETGILVSETLTVTNMPNHGIAVPDIISGTVIYTPTTDYIGFDTFSYQICDGLYSGNCGGAEVAILVTNIVTDTPIVSHTIEIPINASSDDASTNPHNQSYPGSDCYDDILGNEVYFGECADGTSIVSGFRFENVAIPPGSNIISAHLKFVADHPYINAVSTDFYGEASDNSLTFSESDLPLLRPITSNFVNWSLSPEEPWINEFTIVSSPDLTPVLEEIVNRPNWQSGNAIAIIAKNVDSNGVHRRVFSYERSLTHPDPETAYPARLFVTFEDIDISLLPNLEINKFGPGEYTSHQLITYTINVSNTGGNIATNVVVSDTLPSGSTYVGGGTLIDNAVYWYLPQLLPDELVNLSFSVTGSRDPVQINNDYRAMADNDIEAIGSFEVISINQLPIGSEPNLFPQILSISKTAPEIIAPGEPLTYTLTITNTDPEFNVFNIQINDDVPRYATYVSGGIPRNNNRNVSWQISGLGPLESVQVSYVVTPTIASSMYPIVNENYQATGRHFIHGIVINQYPVPPVVTYPESAILRINKTAPSIVEAGEPITYTLTASNNSDNLTIPNITVTDTIPIGANYVEGGVRIGNIVSWTIPSLAAGESVQVQYVVTATESIINDDYMAVSTAGYGAVAPYWVGTLIQPGVDFAATPLIGTVPFTTSFANLSSNASDYFWEFGDGGSSETENPTYTYTQPGTYEVTLSAGSYGITSTHSKPSYIIALPPITNSVNLSIEKNGPAIAVPGELVTYTLTATNLDVITATNVVITDNVPIEATYASGGDFFTGESVGWFVPELGGGESLMVQFAVTATQTMTNDDYQIVSTTYPAQVLTPNPEHVSNGFGEVVAVQDGLAVIGIPYAYSPGGGAGQIYVYRQDSQSGYWYQEASLFAHDGWIIDEFGDDEIAIGNNMIAVGVSSNNENGGQYAGAVYVYIYDNTTNTWSFVQKVLASDGEAQDRFGGTVVIEGQTMFVGAVGDDDNGDFTGAVYQFEWNDSLWVEQQKLTPSSAENGYFGGSMAFDGDTLVVGASGHDSGAFVGSAYVYQHNGTSWILQQILADSSGTNGDLFGSVVDVDGNSIAVVTARNTGNGSFPGAIIIYTIESDLTWHEQAMLAIEDETADPESYIWQMDLSGDRVFVSYEHSEGAVQSFRRENETWFVDTHLDFLASYLAYDGNALIVGTYDDNVHIYNLANALSAVGVGQDSVTTEVYSSAILHIEKEAPGIVASGELITYTLTVRNDGNALATNLVVTDTVPDDSAYIQGGTYINGEVQWSIAELQPGASTQMTFAVTSTATVVNDSYGVVADGGYSATGQRAIVTYISTLPNGYWWNDQFFYRRALSLTASEPVLDETIEQNTVAVTVDTAALIDEGKLREDGRDLRITYRDALGWHVLPTEISDVISPTATLTFSLQIPIETVDTISGDYWLYYGNQIAEPVPNFNVSPILPSQVISEVTGTDTVTPTVSFLASSRQAWTPATISFTSYVSPTLTDLTWDFGDGTTSQISQTTHTYSAPGSYTVTLTADTGNGLQVTYGYQDYFIGLVDKSQVVSVSAGDEETPVRSDTLSDQGGIVESAEGNLSVHFPAEAVLQTMIVTHTPHQATIAQNPGSVSRFDLSAVDEQSGTPVTQFPVSVTMQFDYASRNLTPDEAETIVFFYWDEVELAWMPLPTNVDVMQGVVTAETNHFTEFAVATNFGLGGGPSVRRLPSVGANGVDLLTGAATYAYPLEVPPGTRGMQPNLALVYNSGVADTLLDHQAGLVGHGFELAGLGWIERDDVGVYYLNLNGVSERLIPEDGTNRYHTEHETFWQIELRSGDVISNGVDGQYWLVTTQDGTQYRFGANPDSSSYNLIRTPKIEYPSGEISTIVEKDVYRSNLDLVEDVYGNQMNITYGETSASLPTITTAQGITVDESYEIAAWPIRISYTENDELNFAPSREIVFYYDDTPGDLDNNNGIRSDFPSYEDRKDAGPGQTYGYTKALSQIEMTVGSNHVRTYELRYQYYTQEGGQPGSTRYGPRHYHLMLEDILEYGTDNSAPIPTTLLYAETGHLEDIFNGYGGHVEYVYEPLDDSGKNLVVFDNEGRILGTGSDDADTERWRVVARHIYNDYDNRDDSFAYHYDQSAYINGQFRGHPEVSVTSPDGTTSTTWFSMGAYITPEHVVDYLNLFGASNINEAIWGKPVLIKVDKDGGTLSVVQITYQATKRQYEGVVSFVTPQVVRITMGDDPDIETRYAYDVHTGNLTGIYENGNVDDPNDNRFTTFEFYDASTTYERVINYPHHIRVFGPNGLESQIDFTNEPSAGYALDAVTITQLQLNEDIDTPDLVQRTEFDVYGNAIKRWTGDESRSVTYDYDDAHQTFPETIYYPEGVTEGYEYDARFGLVTSYTDGNGFNSSYAYDPFGRIEVENGTSGRVTYDYFPLGGDGLEVVATYEGEGDDPSDDFQIRQQYNGLGQLVKTINPGDGEDVFTTFGYDGLGRLITSTVPYTVATTVPRVLTTVYDGLGRVVSAETLDGTTTYTYNGWRELVIKDALLYEKEYTLTAFGQVVSVNEVDRMTGDNHLTRYAYNPLGNLIQITDDAEHLTAMQYDTLGRKVSMNDPSMGTWEYQYDSMGDLFWQLDARGVETTLVYDDLGRLTNKSYITDGSEDAVDTTPVALIYEGAQLRRMEDGSGQTVWGYDAAGRLLSEQKQIGGYSFVTSYTYDDFGRLETMSYPDGEVVTYTHNAAGQVKSLVSDLGVSYLSDATYTPWGQPRKWEFGSGILQQEIGYNPTSFRPDAVTTVNAAAVTVQELALTFNAVGQLDDWTNYANNATEMFEFAYDGLHRLEGVTATGWAGIPGQNYDYDDLGNLTQFKELTLIYGNVTRPYLPSTDSENTTYEYDVNGNLISKTFSGDGAVYYQYDAENRLIQVISQTTPIEVVTTMIYDGQGQLVYRQSSTGSEVVYPGQHIEYPVSYTSADELTSEDVIQVAQGTAPMGSCITRDSLGTPFFTWTDENQIYFSSLNGMPVVVSDIEDPMEKLSSDIAVSPTGEVYVVWQQLITDTAVVDYLEQNPNSSIASLLAEERYTVYAKQSEDEGSSWGDLIGPDLPAAWSGEWDILYRDTKEFAGTMRISPGGSYWVRGESTDPKVAVDSSGIVHVVWYARDGGSYNASLPGKVGMHSYYDGEWSLFDDNISLGSSPPDIAVSENGVAYIIFTVQHNGFSRVFGRKGEMSSDNWVWYGGAYSERVDNFDESNPPTPPTNALTPVIALGSFSNLTNLDRYAAWQYISDGTNDYGVYGNLSNTSNLWGDELSQVSIDASTESLPIILDVDQIGNVHLLWETNNVLMYSFSSSAELNWSTPIQIPWASGLDLRRGCGIAGEQGEGVDVTFTSGDGVYFFHLGRQLGTPTKRYFVDGQQVAMRQEDALYYTVNDPSGTMQMVMDEAGELVGRTVFDAFNGVLENTVPMTLTQAFPNTPDAATGLLHLGNGRWYDPAWGRPLQPNAAGGPPTVPQALNRFAATPLGQPGVAVAATSSFNWTPSAVSFVYGTTTQLVGLTPKFIGKSYSGYALVEVMASRSALTRNWRKLDETIRVAFTSPAFGATEGKRIFFTRVGIIPLAGNSLDDLTRASDDVVRSLQNGLPGKGPWAARISSQVYEGASWSNYKLYNQLDNWNGIVTGIGAGLDFVLGFGFQLHNDYESPYLSTGQVFVRATLSGGLGAGVSFAFGIGGNFLCGPPCAVLGAVGGGILWSEFFQPIIFESPLSPLKPAPRNLLGLG
jgi:uncharacterized repeat protein (TIGR01451 family)